tara:strand:- start:1293 stop:1481 length:189 start_codon:yes stop_codon:yes gene_type:complete
MINKKSIGYNHDYYFVCTKKGFILSQGIYTKLREQIDFLDFVTSKGYKVIFKQSKGVTNNDN